MKRSPRKSKSPSKRSTKRSRSPSKRSTKRSRSPSKKTAKRSTKHSTKRSRSPSKRTTKRSNSPRKRSVKRKSPTSEHEQNCLVNHNKKYKERDSPPIPAQLCRNQIRTGNDGNAYLSKPDKNHVYHWKRI